MAIKQEVLIFLFIGITACVTSNYCPRRRNFPECTCHEDFLGKVVTDVHVRCIGHDKGSIADYSERLLNNSFDEKRNLHLNFVNFNKESRLPSRIFEGFHIKTLEFSGNYISRWADEEGGPAFVGLEDSLETFSSYLDVPRFPYPIYPEDHADDKALMTLGHLRKLKSVSFHSDDMYRFDRNWFGEGGKSLQELELDDCNIRHFGDGAFAGLTNLESFISHKNPIFRVTRSMFPNPANKLRAIFMSFNELKYLPEDLFDNMPELRFIRLSGTLIAELPSNLWRPVWSKLESLDLGSELHCDDRMNWMFELKLPRMFFGICQNLDFLPLRKFIMEKKIEKNFTTS